MSTTTSERVVVNGVKKQLLIGGEWRDATEAKRSPWRIPRPPRASVR